MFEWVGAGIIVGFFFITGVFMLVCTIDIIYRWWRGWLFWN